jgi:hypothetical protein
MLKSLLSGDPAAVLDKTRAKLSGVEDNIASLRTKRAEVLLAAEDAGAVVTIDKAIEAETANAAIYRDRIKALQEECRRQLFQQREGERAMAIEKIALKLKRREAIAAQLEDALGTIGRLYSELLGNDEVSVLWPFSKPGHGWATLDIHSVNKELSWASYGLCKQHRFPEPGSIGLGVIGVTAIGVAETVRAQNESIIARLETAPISVDLMEEPAA